MAPRGTKRDRTPAAEKDAVEEALSGVFDLMERDANITEAAHILLRKTVPLCLKRQKNERHAYQEQTVELVLRTVKHVEATIRAAVEEVRAEAEKCQSERGALAASLQAAASKEAEGKAARDDLTEKRNEADGRVANAKTALKAEESKAELIKADHVKLGGDKANREALLETWEKLKECAFPGKQWRQRDKAIDSIVSVLETLNVEASLKLAISVALKARPEERHFFAAEAIKFCGEHLEKSLAAMNAKLEGHDDEVAKQNEVIDQAKVAVEAAKEAGDAVTNEWIAAENLLSEASEAHKEVRDIDKTLASRLHAYEEKLSSMDDDLSKVSTVVTGFEAMLEHGLASSSPVEGAAVGGPNEDPSTKPADTLAGAEG